VAGVSVVLLGCGSSSTSSSSSGGGTALAAIQAAFANYGTQSSAHLKVVEQGGPANFDVDVTKDGIAGSVTISGQQYALVYAGGTGYVQTTAGGPFTALPADEGKAFSLFTIGTLSSCFSSLIGSAAAQFTQSVSTSQTTVNGTAGTDYKAPDGSGDIIISSGSSPLPLRLTTSKNSSSSSTSSSSNPACDVGGSSSSSSSSSGGSLEIDWTYPGAVTTITPPPTS
jgi:hypothetical protein